MNEQACGNCCFFKDGSKCCKYPPFNNVWPAVDADDWCGQWMPCILEEPKRDSAGDTE